MSNLAANTDDKWYLGGHAFTSRFILSLSKRQRKRGCRGGTPLPNNRFIIPKALLLEFF